MYIVAAKKRVSLAVQALVDVIVRTCSREAEKGIVGVEHHICTWALRCDTLACAFSKASPQAVWGLLAFARDISSVPSAIGATHHVLGVSFAIWERCFDGTGLGTRG